MLDFLKKVQVTAPAEDAKKTVVRKERNPVNADLRVFADGSVFPSAELVQRFRLEYGSKPAEGTDPIGNGFDIIPSEDFKQYLVVGRKCVWISPVPRAESKIDLFGTVGYNKETGEPALSVLDQGTVTFGKTTLLPLLESAYGISLDENKLFHNGKNFIDLKFHGTDEEGTPFFLPPGRTVAFIPKAKQRGEEKGTPTVIKRENPEFYCLFPVDMPAQKTEVKEAEVSEVN